MNTNAAPLSDDIPEILRDELARTRPLTPAMLGELAKANRALQEDPAFSADVLKGLFVNEMLMALEEREETKAQLAGRIGRTRQYVQKLFDEDRRVNFTIDTLCAIAHALGRRVHLHVCKPNEEPMILTAMKRHADAMPLAGWNAPAAQRRESAWLADFEPITNTTALEEVNHVRSSAA